MRGSADAPGDPLTIARVHTVNGLVLLDVRINGQTQTRSMVLDTGSSPCVVDPVVADSLRIESAPSERERIGGAGTFRTRVTTAQVILTVNGLETRCTETLVTDLTGVAQSVGTRIDGIMGGDFFRGRVVRIDYDRSEVEVWNRDRAGRFHANTARIDRIPMRVRNNRPYIHALLAVPGATEAISRELLVDIGSQDNVDDTLLRQSAEQLRSSPATGLGSGATAQLGRFREVRIGRQHFENVPGVAGSVSIIGTGLLARFNLVFDYDGQWMELEPGQGLR